MDALMFFRELNRMCRFYKGCDGCPFCDEECCPTIIGEKADEIVQFVERWSKNHPQKTRLQDFLEKYPNAPIEVDGTPKVCCENLGYCKDCNAETDCVRCWNKAMEE
ncbi:MAG: hypothetical protein ACLVG7_01510 [Negativibacillus sp.]